MSTIQSQPTSHHYSVRAAARVASAPSAEGAQETAGAAEADRLMDQYNPTVGRPDQQRAAAAQDAISQVNSYGAQEEQQTLKQHKDQGQLIPLQSGDPSKGTTLTIHGINGSVEDMRGIDQSAAKQGQSVMTFAYDSHYRRMSDASSDLASGISQWQQGHPGEKLTIDAHSSGGRIAAGALQQLSQKNDVKNPTQFNALAPILGGYAAANTAILAPNFVARQFKNALPGKDVGTWSGYQQGLESNSVSPNVNTTIYAGTNDTYQDRNSSHYQAAASRFNPTMVTVPGADHMSLLDRFASDTLH